MAKASSFEHFTLVALAKRFGLMEASEIASALDWKLPASVFEVLVREIVNRENPNRIHWSTSDE
jgi:hypothetical protein